MLGYLDRFEGNLAVILIEENQTECQVQKSDLPAGSEVGTVFNLKEEKDTCTILSINENETKQRKDTALNLHQSLQKRKKRSTFKRK